MTRIVLWVIAVSVGLAPLSGSERAQTAHRTVIEIMTSQPVTLRDLTVHVPGLNGILGIGNVDLTVEGTTVIAINPPLLASSNLIMVSNDAVDDSRARMIVRESFLDGAITSPPVTQSFGLRPQGNIDALLERNVIRRVGGACGPACILRTAQCCGRPRARRGSAGLI